MSRSIPRPTKVSAPFWAACRERRLSLQRCSACHTYAYYPVYMCPKCAGLDLVWTDVSGRGTIYSKSLVMDPVSAASAPDGPLMVVLVELEEGPVMMSNVVGADAQDVQIGDPVRVAFQDINDDITLPVFERV